MRAYEPDKHTDNQPSHLNKRLKLLFYETESGRTCLRFTRWAVILILGLTVVSIISILVIFLLRSQPSASEPVNVNVSLPSPSPYLSNKPILSPPPPQPQPPKVAQPVYSMPTPSNTT